MLRKTFTLLISLVLAFTAGYAGASVTMPGVWYGGLSKSFINPPSWIFAPVWTLLYALMAVAAWRVYEQMHAKRAPRQGGARAALLLYLAHLVVNAYWSFAFFGMHDIALSVGVIAILWFMVALLMTLFFRLDRTAGWLLVPYLLWVSFAAYLNVTILLLN